MILYAYFEGRPASRNSPWALQPMWHIVHFPGLKGWHWDAALHSSLMGWIDLKGLNWCMNEAYFVKSLSSIFSNLFFLCASEFARIGWDKDGGPFLFGRNKKTLLNHHACNPKKIRAMTISSLAPCIWLEPINFYNRSDCWMVMNCCSCDQWYVRVSVCIVAEKGSCLVFRC